MIEHNLDVKMGDCGLRGRPAGGRIVAEGSPETVATVKDSFTGQFLAHMLDGRPAPAVPADPKPRRGRKAMRG